MRKTSYFLILLLFGLTSSCVFGQVITEDFSKMTSGTFASPSSSDIGPNLNPYTLVAGWTGSKVYSAAGTAKIGTSSAAGYLSTPTIDLSASGNFTVSFQIQKWGSDANSIVQVFHAPDGVSFAQIGTDITSPATFTTFSVDGSGGTVNSKIKIVQKNSSNGRFYIDNFSVSTLAGAVLILDKTTMSFPSTLAGSISAEQSYKVSASGLTANLTITPPAGYEISTSSGAGFQSTPITLTHTAGVISQTTIYVRFTPGTAGSFSGNLTHASAGLTSQGVALSGVGLKNYYLASAGSVDALSSWWSNSDGMTGAQPANFTDAGQIFNIINQSAPTLGAAWAVSGSGSKIILGDGTNPCTFVIPSGKPVTGTVDVSPNAMLSIQDAALPTFGSLATASTVEYAQAGTAVVTSGVNYGNLKLKDGTKTLAPGTTTVSGNLTVDNVTGFQGAGSPFSTVSLAGNLTLQNGSTIPADVTNGFTLVCSGSSPQTLQGNGATIQLFRLTLNNSSGVILANGTTNLQVGNLTSGGITFTNGNLTVNDNTVTFYAGKAYISGSGGSFTCSPSSNFVFNNITAAASMGTFTLTSGSQTINNLTINLLSTNNKLTLGSNITVNGTLQLSAGSVVTGSNILTLGPSATLPYEGSNSYVIGTLRTTRNVGFGAGTFATSAGSGGMGVLLSPGANDIGNVTVTRVSGTAGVVTYSGKSGISRRWTIASDNPITGTRDLSLSWVSDDDNGKSLNSAQVYRSPDGMEWLPVGSAQSIAGTRTAALTGIRTLGNFTVSDNSNILSPPLPAVPVLSSPANNAVDQLVNNTFSWEAVSDASSYKIEIAADAAFASVLMSDSAVTTNSKTFAGFSNATKYYWRVASKNITGTSAYSDVWNFTTMVDVPITPAVILPADNATYVSINPWFRWRKSLRSVNYALQVATDAAFTSLVYDDSALTDTVKQVTGLNYTTDYYWRAAGKNNVGLSPWSPVRKFTTTVPPPATPVVTGPALNLTDQPLSFTITFNPSAGAESYVIQVARDVNFQTLLINDTTVTGTSFEVTGLKNTTKYAWRVAARNRGGWSTFSPAGYFTTVVAAPDRPVLSSPPANAVNQTLALTLSWNSVPLTNYYILQIASDAGFTQIIKADSSITGTSKSATGLLNSKKYYWRVAAANNRGIGEFSAAWSFTTIPAVPAVPALALPADNTASMHVIVELSWNSAADAALYIVQAARDSLFTNKVLNDSTVTATSRIVGGLLNSTQYFWRVASKNAAGTSAFSAHRTFTTVIAPPAAPVLTSALNNAVNMPLNPTLSWNEVPGAAGYVLQVASDQAFANIILADAGLTGLSRQITGLQNSTRYYWRVAAKNIGGTGTFSAAYTFLTVVAAPSSPVLYLPAASSVNQPVNLTLTWNDYSDAGTYILQIAKDANFTTLVITDTVKNTTAKAVSGLTNSTRFYWRVAAKNAGGTSNFSSPFSFTTIVAVPVVPVLAGPVTGAENAALKPVLSWRKSPNAVSYHLQVSRDKSFTDLAVNDSSLSDTTAAADFLSQGSQYYWRVSAANISGKSAFSAAWDFKTQLNAPAALMVASNGQKSVTIAWTYSGVNVTRFIIQRKTGDTASTNAYATIDSVATGVLLYTDTKLSDSARYSYRVYAVNAVTKSAYSNQASVKTQNPTGVKDLDLGIPSDYVLNQNYPNPFNPNTVVRFGLPGEGNVKVTVYNLLGARVDELVNSYQAAGYHEYSWDASRHASGIYICVIEAQAEGSQSTFRKMIKMNLIK